MDKKIKMKMEYNTQKEHLRVPEYGRNVQILVDFIVGMENREDRNKAAKAIVNLLAQQNPQMRNQPEFQQKIWDQLFIISDYKLDVDAPYPVPENPMEEESSRKRKVDYHKREHKYHFYGENVELMIKRAIELEDEEVRTRIINSIAHYMKISYKTWNDDKVSDEIIIEHLRELSGGKIILEKMPESTKTNDRPYNKDFNNNSNKKYKSKSYGKKHRG